MEGAKTETPYDEGPSNVASFSAAVVAKARRVAPLTDQEILALRQMLKEFESIKLKCPLAQRALGI